MRRVLVLSLCCVWGASLHAAPPADLVIQARGHLDHVLAAAEAPEGIQEKTTVTATFTFAPDSEPVARDEETATYAARGAVLAIGERKYPLMGAQMIVMRHAAQPFGPAYGYLLRGVTEAGWMFSLMVVSDSPATVASFSLPTAHPGDVWPLAQDVTLRDVNGVWDAYGNGTIATVATEPVEAARAETPHVESLALAEAPGE